jgi:hypothetical protein
MIAQRALKFKIQILLPGPSLSVVPNALRLAIGRALVGLPGVASAAKTWGIKPSAAE